jgi:hypothetical protein
LVYYSTGQPKYNLANPDCREWWINKVAELAYGEEGGGSGPKSDVLFIDSIQKALEVASNDNYRDYWGNPVSDTYMEKAVAPLLETIRDVFSEDFILQGNIIRASTTYTEDSNLSYVSNYFHSSYLEGFEIVGEGYAANIHKGIDAVQQAVDMGKMICPNIGSGRPYPCTELTIEEMRAKASAAMPVFWEKLDAGEQDDLAEMYAYFDYKLAMFLIMAGEHSYLRFQDSLLVNDSGSYQFQMVPPFPEFDRKLGAPLSDGIRVSDTTWVREFEYCMVTLDVDGGIADVDWTHRSDGQTENMAIGKPSYQSSTAGDETADRANDGNTDPELDNDSVARTDNGTQIWWEFDLEAVREIGHIDVWGSTYKSWLLEDVYVLVSVDPFESTDFATTLAQPGVKAYFIDGRIDRLSNGMASVHVDIPGRYVRVVQSNPGSCILAEVQVWSAATDTGPVLNFTVGASNVLEWAALPTQVYHVYWSSNLLSGFTLVGSNVINGLFIDTSYSAEPAGFYKLTAEPQP